MKLTTDSSVPVYTIAGEGTSRPLPEWLARKRKRSLKKDSEYANRVELLQDFEFEEASQCVRVSEDGEWVVSTGTYKPQIHTHYLPHLSLSYARHTNALNQKFILLSSDYSKSLHLQSDRCLEFHTPSGLHYTTRIPRYGRDLKFNKRAAEALVPAVGVNGDGNGEVFRLNLEVGRFMKGFEVDVGGDDFESLGGGALQGGIRAGSVNCAAVAEESHGLLAFGTSLGTVEFWDSRSRNRVSALGPSNSSSSLDVGQEALRPEITTLEFHPSGLNFATGDSNGIVQTYDLRSPVPLLRKDQGYGSPIQTLQYLTPAARSSSSISPNKLLSADRKSVKLFDSNTGNLWTSVEPAVDLNHVEWVPDSGMLLTANEGRQQHSFFIPQLGPAPKWCGFLDNLVEEMAEDADVDPNAFHKGSKSSAGEVYDNFKFVDRTELRNLNLDHLIGTTNLLRPYMHGYFVPQGLYEQARLLANPDIALQQRQKSIQEKIDKERESRIRGNKRVAVKVNRRLAEKLAAREEANEKRKAQRLLRKRGDEVPEEQPRQPLEPAEETTEVQKPPKKATTDLMADDRFKRLFEDEDYEIDETSREFQMLNPSSAPGGANVELKKRGLTAVEMEDVDERHASSDFDSEGDEDEQAEAAALRARQRSKPQGAGSSKGRIGSSSYKKSGHQSKEQRQEQRSGPRMQISSSNADNVRKQRTQQSKSFGDLASNLKTSGRNGGFANGERSGGAVGEKEVTFAPAKTGKKQERPGTDNVEKGRQVARGKERRSASGNTFRRL
ncbi:Small ribosomal subunit biogenesis [Vermiconidia calcicola]|uniref:Small ribosomal subunit biogenesis n=1 Tax=Vermiconidia calcicola TaxID=1690605 RepID=A0ACC3MRU7_9PEZI|nr:Small ribosomal subunit biogenesis [Vermiconidia calcicola]